MISSIITESQWGVTVENEYLQQESDTLVILFPGKGYYICAPYLYYAYSAASECGYDVLAIEYGFQKANKDFGLSEINDLIKETKDTIQKCLNSKTYKNIIFIGKSLGAYLSTAMIEDFKQYQMKHICLTPTKMALDGIKKADCFVVVGNEDPNISQEFITEITELDNTKIKIIDGVGHDLNKTDYEESILVLKDVMKDIVSFIR
jgi:esterase/lipase